MKVLVCAYACLPEGSFRWVGTGELTLGWNIVKQLARFNRVYVLTSLQLRLAVEEAAKKDQLQNITFYYVDLPFFLHFLLKFEGGIHLYAYLWQIQAYFLARKLHRELKFDLFHHLTYANDWMASFIGALLPVPYIRGPGGGMHRIPKAFFKEFSFSDKLWQYIRILGQWIARHDLFFILGQRKAARILVCNDDSFNAVPKKLQRKVSIFPVNGIDLEEVTNCVHFSEEGKNRKFRFISAGTLWRFKGFSFLIKAFEAFIKNNKDCEVEFIIYGDGPEYRYLYSMINSYGLQKKIYLNHQVSRKELLSIMSYCDVFLFASLRDGGAAVIVEAMASGLPVICLDIGGPGFHIQPEWGIKIKPKDPEYVIKEIANALSILYKDTALRLRMGEAANRRAKEYYLWPKLGDRLQEIYDTVLK